MTEEETEKKQQRQEQIRFEILEKLVEEKELDKKMMESVDFMSVWIYNIRQHVYQTLKDEESFGPEFVNKNCRQIFRLGVELIHRITTDLEFNALGEALHAASQ